LPSRLAHSDPFHRLLELMHRLEVNGWSIVLKKLVLMVVIRLSKRLILFFKYFDSISDEDANGLSREELLEKRSKKKADRSVISLSLSLTHICQIVSLVEPMNLSNC
jgi:hypothetical protein